MKIIVYYIGKNTKNDPLTLRILCEDSRDLYYFKQITGEMFHINNYKLMGNIYTPLVTLGNKI